MHQMSDFHKEAMGVGVLMWYLAYSATVFANNNNPFQVKELTLLSMFPSFQERPEMLHLSRNFR